LAAGAMSASGPSMPGMVCNATNACCFLSLWSVYKSSSMLKRTPKTQNLSRIEHVSSFSSSNLRLRIFAHPTPVHTLDFCFWQVVECQIAHVDWFED
jgi:hypothetical protein